MQTKHSKREAALRMELEKSKQMQRKEDLRV